MEILKIDGVPRPYLLWSEKEGRPLTNGMTEKELRKYFIKNLRENIPSFDRKLERAKERGCSSFDYRLKDLLDFNCAGPDGKCLSREEIIELYCS